MKIAVLQFPGTNCEVDTARALERAGAQPHIVLIRNLTAEDIRKSADAGMNAHIAKPVDAAQMFRTLEKFCRG